MRRQQLQRDPFILATTGKHSGIIMNKQQGFSLIELVVVTAIIAITASIGVPRYNQYVIDVHRNDATSELLNLMQRQEDFYANDFTYTDLLVDINADNSADYGRTNAFTLPSERYYIEAAACGHGIKTCVELTATAINGQLGDGDFTLTSQNERTFNGSTGWPK